MSETMYCQVCNESFSVNELTEGICSKCLALKAKPHATHTVFTAEDLDWHGRRSWWGPIVGAALLGGALVLWQMGAPNNTVKLDPANEVTLEELLAEEDPDWVLKFDQSLRVELATAVARLRRQALAAGSLDQAKSLGLDRARRAGRWQITLDWQEDGPWIVATPEPPLSRHILIAPDKTATSAFGAPATEDDDSLVWIEPAR